jgi:hypothetical protein
MKEKNALTMLAISTGFILVFFLFKWQGFLWISFGIGITGLFSSYLTARISWLWERLGELLGLVIPKIILGGVFFIILFPVSFLARLFRKDPLMLSEDHSSYFIDYPATPTDKKYFEKPW